MSVPIGDRDVVRAAFTCISAVHPKVGSLIRNPTSVSQATARNGPRSVTCKP